MQRFCRRALAPLPAPVAAAVVLLDVFDGDHRQRTSERLEQVILPWVGALLKP